MDVDARLAQIEKISLNARTTWFALVALLVFIGVTIMGHKDSDFFAFEAETQLPLLNMAVRTEDFFIAAPVLAASLYIYLHIYLNDLWVALGDAPSFVRGEPLGQRIYPTMLGTSALILRRWLRREPAPPVKNRGLATIGISLLITWVFGPVVLAVVWWRSWPYHEEWLTLWIAFWFWLALVAGMGSFVHLWMQMRRPGWQPASFSGRKLLRGNDRALWSAGRLSSQIAGSVLLFAALGAFGWAKTEGGLEHYWPRDRYGEFIGEPWFTSEDIDAYVSLARVNLIEAELTGRPKDWSPYQIWLKEWEKTFRDREGIALSKHIDDWTDEQRETFEEEAAYRWRVRSASIDTVSLKGRDLRNANLVGAFLTGVDLREANLEGAHLLQTNLKGAILDQTSLKGAYLAWANLEGADLSSTNLEGAYLEGAHLKLTNLKWASLDGANLRRVDLSRVGSRISQADIDAVFGDSATILPEGLFAPCHWDDQVILPLMRDDKHQAWLDGGAIPIPRSQDGTCPGETFGN